MNVRRLLLATDAVGGVWTYSIELARGLRDLGVEVLIASMGPSPTAVQLCEADGLRVLATSLPLDWLAERPQEVHVARVALARLAHSEQVDVVQLHSAALACDLELSSAKIGSGARLGGVNIRKSSFTNARASLLALKCGSAAVAAVRGAPPPTTWLDEQWPRPGPTRSPGGAGQTGPSWGCRPVARSSRNRQPCRIRGPETRLVAQNML